MFETFRELLWRDPRWISTWLPLAGVLVLLGTWRTRRERPRTLSLLHLGLRLASLVLLAVVAAGPMRTVTIPAPGRTFALVDASASVDAAEREQWLERVVAPSQSSGTTVASFGDRLRSLDSNEDPSDTVAPLSTRLRSALATVGLHPEARFGSRLQLWTDGRIGESVVPIDLAVLAPRVHPSRTEPPADAAVLELLAEPGPRPEEPWTLKIRGVCPAATSGELAISVPGQSGQTSRVELPAGPFEFVRTVALEAGWHWVSARLDLGADAAWNNQASTLVKVWPPTAVRVVGGESQSLLVRALRAQGIVVEHHAEDRLRTAVAELPARTVLVLDRIGVAALADPVVLTDLTRRLDAGQGILYWPAETPRELVNAAGEGWLDLIGLRGIEPPPPPPPDQPKPEVSPTEAPDVVDENARKKELRTVPSLGLLLLIDGSSSMRGETLRLAKEAAIAAVEVLHPEDFVGVVAFNQESRVLVELGKAKDVPAITERIARIAARGGTDFVAPLETAKEMFALANLAVRHAILLTDGEPNEMRPLKALVEGMASAGITLSTVGCGSAFNETLLSDLAAWGRGKFHPAYDANEVPEIFTIEAERVIESSGARRRSDEKAPPPRDSGPTKPPLAAPPPSTEAPLPTPEAVRIRDEAPYLLELPWSTLPGVEGRHPARARADAWVSLETEGGAPVLVHSWVGRGRIVAWALPLEGSFGPSLARWEGVGPLLAQITRFLDRSTPDRRLALSLEVVGRSIELAIADGAVRESDLSQYTLRWYGVDREVLTPATTVAVGSTFRVEFPSEVFGPIRVEVESVRGDLGVATCTLSPSRELRERGPDLASLSAWAAAIGGEIAPVPLPAETPPGRHFERLDPVDLPWLPGLLGLLIADILLQRLGPGRRRFFGEKR